jgi:hypothetical protein
LKIDEIAGVTVPSVEQEAARDLVRACEDVRCDLMRARHRLSKALLMAGAQRGRASSTPAGTRGLAVHDGWMRSQRFGHTGQQLGFDSAYETMIMTGDRRDRLDAAIVAMAADSEYTAVARRLCCLRRVSTLTGFGLAVESATGLDSPAPRSARSSV